MSAPLFDPTAAPVGREVKIATRPIRLDGLRVGLVDNTSSIPTCCSADSPIASAAATG